MNMEIKTIIKKNLYDLLFTKGKLSSRENVLTVDSEDNMENKVYVRKLPVHIPVTGTTIRMISIASDNENFSDVNADDIRIGFENCNKQWTNLFIDEVPDAMLDNISFFFSVPNSSTC